MLLSAQGVTQKSEDMFPTLRKIKEDTEASILPDQPEIKGDLLDRLRRATGGDTESKNLF